MSHIETIRTLKTKHFTVRVAAVEDFDTDLSFDETGQIERDIAAGRLMAFGVNVTVFLDGAKVGSDFLGGCIYKSPAEFMDHFGVKQQARKASEEVGRPICVGSYFSDMIRQAIAEARKTVCAMQSVYIRN